MVIWIIEDDAYFTEAIQETITDTLPDARIEAFRDLREVSLRVSGPDILIIDISAVCPISQSYMFGEFLWPFGSRWPGTSIIVCSALGTIVRDQVLEIFREHGVTSEVHFQSCDFAAGGGLAEQLINITGTKRRIPQVHLSDARKT